MAGVSWHRFCQLVLESCPEEVARVRYQQRRLWSRQHSGSVSAAWVQAIHSSTIAWKIPWTEELGGLQSMRHKSRTRLSDFTSLHFKKRLGGDFPSGPVVKTLPSNAEGTGWIPSQGIKIPCDLQCGKRKKKKREGLVLIKFETWKGLPQPQCEDTVIR